MKDEGTFQRFSPTFYRVILYEYSGSSFPGYSVKYFCGPQPYNDTRRFICLNRYRGRLRVRQSSAPDFRYLRDGSVFRIEVQAEATVSGIFMYDRCIFNIRVYAPSTTVLATPAQSFTVPISLSSSPSITRTETIAPSTSDISFVTESSLFTTESSFSSFLVSSINPSSHIESFQTPTATLRASPRPTEPTHNGKLPT